MILSKQMIPLHDRKCTLHGLKSMFVQKVHSGCGSLRRHSQTLCTARWGLPVCSYSLSSTLCLLSYLGQQYVMRIDRSKRLSISKKTKGGERTKTKKTGHILTPDNRCCHSEPIIVSIMKSVGQKRGPLSFPYAGPSFLCIPLFIRSRLLITVLFASESRMPYNLLPQ